MRTLSATLLAVLLSAAAMAAPIRITGRVLHPPKDVQVELRPWAMEHAEALRRLQGETAPPLASARPLGDGSFALEVPDAGFYSVVIRAEGHVAMERFVRFVVEETEVPPVELAPASPLEVTAAGADGQPLAGVAIQAIPAATESGEWRAAERRAVTDAGGRAVFPRAAGEALRLFVTTPGRYATASTGPSGALQTVRFPAQPSRMIVIRNPDGRPASGALVRLARRGWPYGLAGEDWRMALPVLSKEEIGFFAEDSRGRRAEIGGEPAATLRPPDLAAGRVLDASSREPITGGAPVAGLELRLSPSAVIRGRILGLREGEERSVSVHAFSEALGLPLMGTVSPGPVYRIDDVGPGEWQVSAQIAPDISVSGQVAVRPGAEEAVLDLELPSGFTLTGRVLVDREPLAGATVGAVAQAIGAQRSGSTGQDGSFRLERLPVESYVLVIGAESGPLDHRTLEINGDLDVALEISTGAVTGRVLRPEGLPVPSASVTLAREIPELETTAPGPGAQSDERGAFEIPRVPAGTYRMMVRAEGFAPSESRVVVPPGGTVRLDVALDPGR